MLPFYGWGSTISWLQWHFEETAYFFTQSPQEFMLTYWTGEMFGFLNSDRSFYMGQIFSQFSWVGALTISGIGHFPNETNQLHK